MRHISCFSFEFITELKTLVLGLGNLLDYVTNLNLSILIIASISSSCPIGQHLFSSFPPLSHVPSTSPASSSSPYTSPSLFSLPSSPLWADAVYLMHLKSSKSVHCAHSEGSWEGRGHGYGDHVKCPQHTPPSIVQRHIEHNQGVDKSNTS